MKKIGYIVCILLDVIALALIPMNIYWFSMPEYTTIIASVLILIASVFVWIKISSKKVGKVILSVVNLIVILATLFGAYCNPDWNSIYNRKNSDYNSCDYDQVLSYKEAKEDYDYAIKYLKKVHPVFLKDTPKEIEEQCKVVEAHLKEYDTIDVCTLSRELESIFSLLSDAHTLVQGNYPNAHYLKYIVEHDQKGEQLIQINGTNIKDLLHQKNHLYSFEEESWAMNRFINDISSLEGLTYLEIPVNEGVVYTYEAKDGTLISVTYHPDDFLTYDQYVIYNHLDEVQDNQDSSSDSFVNVEVDQEHNVAILTLYSCDNNDIYRNCLEEMFTKVKELGIDNVAVDLRNNGGGSSSVANEFLRYIDIDSYKEWEYSTRYGCFSWETKASITKNKKHNDLLFSGNLYLLTSSNSFSAAMNFAEYVKDNHIGTIIGKACGNNPSGYGDSVMFKLPNSQLFMQISTKDWKRIDMTRDGELIEPDVECNPNDAMNQLYELIGSDQ